MASASLSRARTQPVRKFHNIGLHRRSLGLVQQFTHFWEPWHGFTERVHKRVAKCPRVYRPGRSEQRRRAPTGDLTTAPAVDSIANDFEPGGGGRVPRAYQMPAVAVPP